ncbi:MAG: type II toxin-antitoxin system prevent-host-death family antitoxin [Gammaproteobacteria bacterium]|nr:type II toxin-antitoxin system prevent-host-death family antitoxin [Gammaproteobacteria bacterium]
MEINVREARARISKLLDIVEQGEEVVITRHGKPSVRSHRSTRYRSLRGET